MELADNSSRVCDVLTIADAQDDEDAHWEDLYFLFLFCFEPCMVLPLYHAITHPVHLWFPFHAINAQLDCLWVANDWLFFEFWPFLVWIPRMWEPMSGNCFKSLHCTSWRHSPQLTLNKDMSSYTITTAVQIIFIVDTFHNHARFLSLPIVLWKCQMCVPYPSSIHPASCVIYR